MFLVEVFGLVENFNIGIFSATREHYCKVTTVLSNLT